MTEIELKIRLVEDLIAKHPGAIIAAEVPFLFGERRADIVMLENNTATVYEIKSAQDSASRLKDQLKDYRAFFDFCYVVGEPINIKDIRKFTPSSIGLITIDSDKTLYLRKSYWFKRLDKFALVSVFPVHTLKSLSSNKTKNSQISLANALVERFSLTELKKLNRKYLKKIYSHNFELMLIELGEKITADDIYTISQRFPKEIADSF